MLDRSQDLHLFVMPDATVRDATVKSAIVSLLLAGITVVFIGALLLAAWREAPHTNSYVDLADAWLHGHLHVERCLDTDCALFKELMYVVFPPLPAAIILPFVALLGPDFHFFMPLSILVFAGSGILC